MELIEANKVDTNKYEFTVEIPADRFDEAVNSAYLKARGRISMNGFRKGKAPRKMIERMYGEQCFYEDACNILARDDVAKAMETSDVELVAPPEMTVESINKETGVKFKLIGYSKPEIKITDYKGIEVTRKVEPVTDADIDEEIDKMRHKSARIITVEDRPSQMGDTIKIDFTGFKDGVAFEGGSETDYSLKLGSNTFIPGFEDQCCGKNAGDSFSIDVTFPENYQMKELAGSPVVFEINLHEIQTEELPELDDDFVKDVSDFDTIDELKADIRKKREEAAEDTADGKVNDEIFKIIAEKVTEDIPAVMIEKKIDDLMKEFAYRVQMQGFDLDTYCAFTGNSMESLREQNRKRATTEVKLRLALEKVAELEHVRIAKATLRQELNKMAQMYGVSVEKILLAISEKSIRQDLACAEASRIIKESAKIDGDIRKTPAVETDESEVIYEEETDSNADALLDDESDVLYDPNAEKDSDKDSDEDSVSEEDSDNE